MVQYDSKQNREMKHEDFSIGLEFYTVGGKWRCTDVGKRTIAAIQIDHVDVVTYDSITKTKTQKIVTDNPSWFNGPPYAVLEHVFDENDFVGCHLLEDLSDEDEYDPSKLKFVRRGYKVNAD